jgi:hypothetical protein
MRRATQLEAMKPIHRNRKITPTGKGSTTSRTDCWLAALSDKCGHRGSIDRTPKLAIRLSPVPLKEKHKNRTIGRICPFLPPRVFAKCLPARRMVGRGGGDRTHDLRLKSLAFSLVVIWNQSVTALIFGLIWVIRADLGNFVYVLCTSPVKVGQQILAPCRFPAVISRLPVL